MAETIRKVDARAFILVHAGGCNVIQDPIWGTSDDLLNAAMTDRYGTSMANVLRPATPIEHDSIDYECDWLRRVDPRWWCHEFYPNHGNWCRPPEPRMLAREIWMTIAGGPSGFTFWQYRAERVGNETNGYGMRQIDGAPTPRSEAIDRIAGVLRLHGAKLAGSRRPPSRIAMLYSRESDLMGRLQEFHTGPWDISQENGNVDYAYKRALKAAHALYTMAGETVDWVVPGDDLSRCEILHVSAAEMVDRAAADWLRAYVRGGGTLIVEFPFACRDDNTWVSSARPNHGLDDLLGCVETDRVVIPPAGPEAVRFARRLTLKARGWHIALRPTRGKALARWADGSVAAVENTVGKGRVYALGASLSLSFSDTWDDPARKVLTALLTEAGIAPQPRAAGSVWVRRRTAGDREIWFVFNVSDREHSQALPRRPRATWFGEGCAVSGTRIRLGPGAAWVGELAKE